MIHPHIRRAARERALQFLYGQDLTQYNWQEILEDFWQQNPSRPSIRAYGEKLIRGVCAHQAELDEEIHQALDRWSPERIGYVERAILRIAVYEMLHMPDVPPSVAINEAIEVSKRFGAEEAPRFINGVLDRVGRTHVAADSPAAEGDEET
ncbi:MAG: transcription antitermination factor NusB [Candidatus Hydrogenedentes bacterium]|nr:transcription antitermination factor NusB [Candidatus Hydrogenedentota bacterium]